MGPGNNWDFDFSLCKARVYVWHCGDIFMVKILPKALLKYHECEISPASLGMESKALQFHGTAGKILSSMHGTSGPLLSHYPQSLRPFRFPCSAGLMILYKYTPVEFTFIKRGTMTLSRSLQCWALAGLWWMESCCPHYSPKVGWRQWLQMTST